MEGRKKSISLQQKSLGYDTASKIIKGQTGRLWGKHRFRSIVRRVIEYRTWIGKSTLEELNIEDVKKLDKLAQGKGAGQYCLVFKDRKVLLKPPKRRNDEDVNHIRNFFRNINAFKRYGDLRDDLAKFCEYQHLGPDRTVVREGHNPEFLFYVISGELRILKKKINQKSGDVENVEIGCLGPGDIFGEMALLHETRRKGTVVTIGSVDLLMITKKSFDQVLRKFLTERWVALKDALVNFNYFKNWNDKTVHECCVLSKITSFDANQILLGDGKGAVHYVFFILSGECKLIEHLLVRVLRYDQTIKYELYDHSENHSTTEINNAAKSAKRKNQENEYILSALKSNVLSQWSDIGIDRIITTSPKNPPSPRIKMDKESIVSLTLQDVVDEWHEITDAVKMLTRQPATIDQQRYPKNVETVFMQVCNMSRGACFGLGENMKNRRVVSITPCRCLMIPRYWLVKHNKANIWTRVRQFLDENYPNSQQLFNKFVENRRWTDFKRSYSKGIEKLTKTPPNNSRIYDVPYSIRISEIPKDFK